LPAKQASEQPCSHICPFRHRGIRVVFEALFDLKKSWVKFRDCACDLCRVSFLSSGTNAAQTDMKNLMPTYRRKSFDIAGVVYLWRSERAHNRF
jgi:hypothetical protein